MVRQTLDGGFIVVPGIVIASSCDVWFVKLEIKVNWLRIPTYVGSENKNSL